MSLEFAHRLSDTYGDVIITGVNQLPGYSNEDFQYPVYNNAGEKLWRVREKFGKLDAGRIFVTPSYGMDGSGMDTGYFRGILHVVCEGLNDEELLESYKRAITHAIELECTEITVCYYGGGLRTVIKFLYDLVATLDAEIHVCFYHYASFYVETSEALQFAEEESGVKEHIKNFPETPEYEESKVKIKYRVVGVDLLSPEELRKALYEAVKDRMLELAAGREETFSQMLLRLIDESGKTDAEIYNKANIDRRHFSKIRNNRDYVPSKNTVLALALALELDLNNTELLLFRAGFALNKASHTDEIIRLCIEHGFYDLFEINMLLFKYHEDTI